MKKLTLFFFAWIIFVPATFGSGPLSLGECREAARREGKLETLYQLNELDRQANERLEKHPFQTSINGYGIASYQSDSPNPASLTDFPFELYATPKFQYHVGLLLAQPIYSGGQRKLKTDLNDLDHELERTGLDSRGVELDRAVDELFLGILLTRKRDEILSRQLNAVKIKLLDAQRAFEAGIGFRDMVLTLEAQLSKLEADMAGSAAQTAAAQAMLAELTGLPIDADTEFEMPADEDKEVFVPDAGLARLDLEARRIELNKQLARAQALPSLQAFGTAGYGRWPLNFFERRPDLYAVVGLSLVIPLTEWRAANAGTARLDAAARQIELQRENAERRKRVELLKYDGEIARYGTLLAASEGIVAKYEELCEELDRQSDQGVTPMSNYLTALEQLSAARLDCELYNILKLQQQLLRKRYISEP